MPNQVTATSSTTDPISVYHNHDDSLRNSYTQLQKRNSVVDILRVPSSLRLTARPSQSGPALKVVPKVRTLERTETDGGIDKGTEEAA